MPAITRRKAVIVLGMHRSGTSAVAGAAIHLGLKPPHTPLAPTIDNPTGFHEPIPLTELNHVILSAMGCSWYDCLSFNPDVLDDAARAAVFDNCTAVLHQEFADEPAFLVKDPRLCLTLPIWLPALEALNATISVLLVVRHPEEVARSLFWRDMLPESQTAAVWLHHMLEAERMTRGMPRAVVLYTELLQDWRDCMARAGRTAGIEWPIPIDRCERDIEDVVVPSLWHHVAEQNSVAVGHPSIRDLIDEAWSALRRLADNPASIVVQEQLNAVRSRFMIERNRSAGPLRRQNHHFGSSTCFAAAPSRSAASNASTPRASGHAVTSYGLNTPSSNPGRS